MAYVIAAPCIDHMDQSCVQVCPVDCITWDASIDKKLFIDPEACIDCGSCATACPNDAIFRADQLPEAWLDFAWVDAAWYADPAAARCVLDELIAA